MAEITYWGGTISTTALGHESGLTGTINAANPDIHVLTGTVDGEDAAINALLASYRVIGWKVEIDLGEGFAELAPRSYRLGSITESIRQWSATASLELIGEEFNPLVYGIWRGFVPIRITMISGEPSAPVERVRFVGSAIAGPWDRTTRTLSVTAADDGSKFAETVASLNVAADSGQLRDDVILNLLESKGVTVGSWIDLGANGQKPISKPYSLVDQRLLDLALDWIAPCGAWLYWRDGAAQMGRFDADKPSARVLYPKDVVSIGPFEPPAAPTPNKVTVVAVNYVRDDTDGQRTVSFSEYEYSNYARKGAVARQDNAGTITNVSYSDAVATYRLTRQINYTQVFQGDFLIRSDAEEWGYYARRTARLKLNTDGTTVDPFSIATYVYQYEDGSWRVYPVERWEMVQRSSLVKTVVSGVVMSEQQISAQMHFNYVALFELTGGTPPTESHNGGGSSIALTEDGQGVDPFYETTYVPASAYEMTVKEWFTDVDGYLTSEVVTIYKWSRGAVASSARAGAFVYGLDQGQKTYWSDEYETLQVVSVQTTTYQAITGQDSYTVRARLEEPATNRIVISPVEQRSGARPRPEELQPQSKSREVRQSVEDEVRSSLNSVREDVIVNEFCQDEEDCMILANAELRDLSAWPVPLTMPIDHALRADHYVTIGAGFDASIEGMRLLVESVTLQPESNLMSATLLYIPPEVADAEL